MYKKCRKIECSITSFVAKKHEIWKLYFHFSFMAQYAGLVEKFRDFWSTTERNPEVFKG